MDWPPQTKIAPDRQLRWRDHLPVCDVTPQIAIAI